TRGAVGHSCGSSVFRAAGTDARIKAVVGIDPVDDSDVAGPTMSKIAGPTLHLFGDKQHCGSGAWAAADFPKAPSPRLGVTVVGSDHCDGENPPNPLCPLVCGASPWNAAASAIFRRYAVAWLACVLGKDADMSAWVKGASYQADKTATVLKGA